MSRGDIKAGRAFVELFVKTAKLEIGLQKAAQGVKDFGAKVSGIGISLATAGAGAIATAAAITRGYAKSGSQLDDMSQRTGVAADALSELRYAAKMSDVEMFGLQTAFKNLAKTMVEASQGSKGARKDLANLGLTVDMLSGLSPDKQLEVIADALASVQNPAMKAAYAMDIFGKAGLAILPLTTKGAKGIQDLRQRARDLAQDMSTEDVQAAAVFDDAWDDVTATLMGVRNAIGAALAPTLTQIADRISSTIATIAKWIRSNREIVVNAVKVIAAIAVVGGAIASLGSFIVIAGYAFGGLSMALGGLIAVATTLVGVINPITVTIAAIAAGVWLFRDSVVSAGKAVADYFRPELDAIAGIGSQIATDFKSAGKAIVTAWGGIVDAVKAGDLQLAGQIAMAGLEVAWRTGISTLKSLWLDLKFYAVKTWQDFKFSAAEIFVTLFAGVQTAWAETISFIESSWDIVTTSLANSWHKAQLGIGGILIDAAEKAGIVSQEFATAWRDSLKQPLEEKIQTDTAKSQERQQQVEKERQKRLADIRSQMAGMIGVLEADKARAMQALQGTDAAAREDAANRLADAEQRLQALRLKAEQLTTKEADATDKKPGAGTPGFNTRGDTGKGRVFVSFSAAGLAAQRGGRDTVPLKLDQQIMATKSVVEEIRQLREDVEDNDLVFG